MDNLKDLFYYDETSPSGLRHKTDKKGGKSRAGDCAGYLCGPGYWMVSANGKMIYASRVILALHNLEIPTGYVISYIDRDRQNNKISNLDIISRKALQRLVDARQENKNLTRGKKPEISELFYYDETSPSGLRHKVDRYGRNHKSPKCKAGEVAGFISGNGVYKVTFMHMGRMISRRTSSIVLLLHSSPIKKGLPVRYKDGNKDNNSYANIQVGSVKEHISIALENSSCYHARYIGWHCVGNYTYARAQWHEEGYTRNKIFSVKKFGLLPAFAMACKFREAKIAELNANGANYTERHRT